MPQLSSSQKTRVDRLLDELLDLPAEARADYLDRACNDDLAVRAEVESLLRAVPASGDFLYTPARLAADALSDDPAVGTRIAAWRITQLIHDLGQLVTG